MNVRSKYRRRRLHLVGGVGLAIWSAAEPSAFSASSANYVIIPASLDGGGGRSASASYTIQSSVSPGGVATATNYSLRAGLPVGVGNPISDLFLSSNSINENETAGSIVGSFSLAGGENGLTSLALVPGSGSGDNSLFSVVGSSLRSATSFNYEERALYSIRVRAVDGEGSVFEKVVFVTILDRPETPVSFAENGPIGFINGQFQFHVSGENGTPVVIYGSTNLVTWTPLRTNVISNGSLTFTDPRSTTNKASFYQLRGQ